MSTWADDGGGSSSRRTLFDARAGQTHLGGEHALRGFLRGQAVGGGLPVGDELIQKRVETGNLLYPGQRIVALAPC